MSAIVGQWIVTVLSAALLLGVTKLICGAVIAAFNGE